MNTQNLKYALIVKGTPVAVPVIYPSSIPGMYVWDWIAERWALNKSFCEKIRITK